MIVGSDHLEVRHFHLFCGLGGGARGFNRGTARVGRTEARFRCIGGVDCDAAAVRDFERAAGTRGTVLDLFDREQFRAFHGREPGPDWREVGPEDLRRAAGGERPNIVFTSPPCKGFSGLLSESRSATPRYQALNRLALRGVWLALEAWSDDPPEFFLLENVPRIATRGRHLLAQIEALLEHYGYAVAETSHCCGELGGLGQRRQRFLLVARHREKVPPFLYQPPRRPLRSVGDVLGALPLPSSGEAGPMHRMRELQWRTWVRLAFVEAGGDWRSLQRLSVVDGYLADFALAPDTDWHSNILGVRRWDRPAGTVTAEGRPSNGAFSVADPRPLGLAEYSQLGVLPWSEPSGSVTSQSAVGGGKFAVADPRQHASWDGRGKYRINRFDEPAGAVIAASATGNGAFAVADPRPSYGPSCHRNKYRVTGWGSTAGTVIGATRPASGALAVADPRLSCDEGDRHRRRFCNVFRIVRWGETAQAVTGGAGPSAGGQAVADPRPQWARRDGEAWAGEAWAGGGHYGVVPWAASSGAVTASADHDSGPFSVADPRGIHEAPEPVTSGRAAGPSSSASQGVEGPLLPSAEDRLVAVIRSLDGTWHRPFTTLELAALQGLVDPEEFLELHGASDTAWRERIGNAVPPPAAAAIASVMGRAILLASAGETFVLSAEPVWVHPIAIALSVAQPEAAT